MGLALAVWAAVSPAVFPLARGGAVVIAGGIALALLALITLANPFSVSQEIMRLLIAAFVFFIPRFFGFGGGAAWSLRIAGLALVALTVASLATIRHWKTFCRNVSEAAHREMSRVGR